MSQPENDSTYDRESPSEAAGTTTGKHPHNHNHNNPLYQSQSQSQKNPACDHCREKKIRCSRERPTCQHCRASRTDCSYTEPQKRAPEVSRNVHRFEEVNGRLDRIENAIGNLTRLVQSQMRGGGGGGGGGGRVGQCTCGEKSTAAAAAEEIDRRPRARLHNPSFATSLVASSITAPFLNTADGNDNSGKQFVKDALGTPQYLGSSSILSLTTEAQSLAEEKLKSANLLPRRLLDHGMAPAGGGADGASSLEDMSHSSATLAAAIPSYGHHLIREGAAQVKQYIPWKAEALEMVDEFFNSMYHWFPIINEESFRRDLDRMYAEPEVMQRDGAWMVLFNSVILFGHYGKSMNATSHERKVIDSYSTQRKQTHFYNAWSALDDLEVTMTPKLRNVQALFTMSLCSIELSRPALCWSLLSQAARSAQALGLHRRGKPQQSASRVHDEERKALFWCIYILDKEMSLVFGRSASLPEFDCDVELPVDDGRNPFFKNFLAEIELARIHSSIYIRLYSAQAAMQSEHDLGVAILELDREVDGWWERWSDTVNYLNKDRSFKTIDLFEHVQLKFGYYSSVTLINRIARPGMAEYAQSQRKALESARAAIKMTMEVVASAPDLANTGLMLWLFNCKPFTSFFLLFSNIIRNPAAPSSTKVDLPLMQALVDYFREMQDRNYESAARLRSVATAFTNVAISFLHNYRRQVGGSGSGSDSPPTRARKRPRKEDEARRTSEAEDNLPPLYPLPPTGVRNPRYSRHYLKACPPVATAPPAQEVLPGVDLETTSFLRWPSPPMTAPGSSTDDSPNAGSKLNYGSAPQTTDAPDIFGGGGAGGGGGDMPLPHSGITNTDIETLIAEPLGFQMRMEQAATRGPLDFDWFGWEAHFGLPLDGGAPEQGGGMPLGGG